MRALLFFILSIVSVSATVSDGIDGIWLTQKKDSKVEILYNGDDGTYSGKIIWAAEPYGNFEGEQIMKGITYRKDSDTYACPWIYDPKMGVTASGTIRISGDTLYLKARKGIFTKNEIFTRVK